MIGFGLGLRGGWVPLAALACLAVLTGGCRSSSKEPTPLAVPAFGLSERAFVGTPLSGPSAQTPEPVNPNLTPGIRVRAYALARVPDEARTLMGLRARLVVATLGGEPILPSTRMVRDGRYADGDEAAALVSLITSAGPADAARLPEARGVLPAGATSVFEWSQPTGPINPISGVPVPTRLAVMVYRPPSTPVPTTSPSTQETPAKTQIAQTDRVQIAFTLQHLHTDDAQATTEDDRLVQRELVLMDWDPLAGGTVVAVIPTPLSDTTAAAVALLIEGSQPSADPEHARLSEIAAQSLKDASAEAASLGGAVRSEWPALRAGILSLSRPADRRRAVVFVAGQTGARVAEDLALVATDPMLERFAAEAVKEAGDLSKPRKGDEVSWILDWTAIRLLSVLQTENAMTPELNSVLLLHTGEAARRPGSLQYLTEGLTNRKELETVLLAENMIYLEDVSPASRVRAYDWLDVRGKSPPGYDPLAPLQERRDALSALSNPSTTQSADANIRRLNVDTVTEISVSATQVAVPDPSIDDPGGPDDPEALPGFDNVTAPPEPRVDPPAPVVQPTQTPEPVQP